MGLKLTDYLTIVKQPIDLGSVRRKLESDQYADYKDVHADVTLMFKNCYIYNPTTHSVVKMAKKLEQIAEKRFVHMVTRRFFFQKSYLDGKILWNRYQVTIQMKF